MGTLKEPKMHHCFPQKKKQVVFCQDGTHRVSPGEFKQLFITMMKCGEKWVPAVKGLLPDHTEKSYRLQNRMIKQEIKRRGLEIKMETLMSDFEKGIQAAAEAVFPGVVLKGCRFHFAQVTPHKKRQ